MPVTAVVQHQVTDYDAWRNVYDRFADFQKASGVTHQSVHRAKDDPNNLLIIHGFATTADAEAFLASSKLHDAMHDAGVQGQPRIEIYHDA